MAGRAEQKSLCPPFFHVRNFSNSSIKQNSPNILFMTKKFKLLRLGAVDRNRTDTGSPPTDFESVASASFTTTAYNGKIIVQFEGKIKRFFSDSCKKMTGVVQCSYGKTHSH